MSTVPLLSGLYQVAYVTRDLEAGMAQLAAIHGIDRFRVKHDVPSFPGMPEMVIHQAHVFIGSVQIELIQPAGGDDALYRDVCAADPAAVRHHHFGMWVDDPVEYEGLPGALAEQGIPVTFETSIPNVIAAIYADTRRTLGHYVEYVHLLPEAKDKYYADVPRYGDVGSRGLGGAGARPVGYP